jgi:hypothetical protein
MEAMRSEWQAKLMDPTARRTAAFRQKIRRAIQKMKGDHKTAYFNRSHQRRLADAASLVGPERQQGGRAQSHFTGCRPESRKHDRRIPHHSNFSARPGRPFAGIHFGRREG